LPTVVLLLTVYLILPLFYLSLRTHHHHTSFSYSQLHPPKLPDSRKSLELLFLLLLLLSSPPLPSLAALVFSSCPGRCSVLFSAFL
jgi:hypothetical protein